MADLPQPFATPSPAKRASVKLASTQLASTKPASTQPASTKSTSAKLAWLEGIRALAALAILLYHAQLYFTHYGYTPQPTGLIDNWQRLTAANAQLGNPWFQLMASPLWFGFQFVDVFVLISGFVAVVALKGEPIRLGEFYKRRFVRILLPFWTVAWLSYPVLWLVGAVTESYRPSLWHMFVGATFPLFYQYDAQLLLPTSGPWWFVPLLCSLVLSFPLLWRLMQRWGGRNLLVVSLLVTVGYRAMAVFWFNGHPTYVSLDDSLNIAQGMASAGWEPFLSLLAKLSTFVCGMVAAKLYLNRGSRLWSASQMLCCGVICYGIGFACQFSRIGWIFADLLLPLGLTLCLAVLFQGLEQVAKYRALMTKLGGHSYSYFLIHNFVVDRTINLVVGSDLSLYLLMLPIMVIEALIFSIVADYTTPLIQRMITAVLQDLDDLLATSSMRQRWHPKVGNRVRYLGESGWIILNVERLLDNQPLCFCRAADGYRSTWLRAEELEPENDSPASQNGRGQNGRS